MRKKWTAVLSILLAMSLLLCGNVAAQEDLSSAQQTDKLSTLSDTEAVSQGEKGQQKQASEDTIPTYEEYIAGNESSIGTNKEVFVNLDNITALSQSGVETNTTVKEKPAVSITQDEAYAEWSVTTEHAGFYYIDVLYCPLEANQSDISFALYINGKQPFAQADIFLLKRQYTDSNKIGKDARGNEIRPPKTEVFEWNYSTLKDKNGVYTTPFYFRFEAGENKLRFDFFSGNVAIGAIRLYDKEPLCKYDEYIASNSRLIDTVDADELIVIQGENAWRTTDKVLYATYDRQGCLTQSGDNSLNDPAKLRLNTIGQSTWKMPRQKITWEFQIEKCGYYEIGMRARQNLARGIFSTRSVCIDGEVLFSELNSVRVDFNSDWQIKILGDDKLYKFYLEQGRHTISMEVVTGTLGEYVRKLQDLVLELNQLYREIIMVTGTSPDIYRDYKLGTEIPNLAERMESFAQRIRIIEAEMENLDIQAGSDMVVAEQLALQLDSFISKPRTIASRITNFQDNISSMSSWILSLTEQPLEIDYIFIQSPGAYKHRDTANILEVMGFRIRSFLSTFVEDYSTLSDATEADSEYLKVWIGLGRDQAQIVKEMIDNDFTPSKGIPVFLSLVQQGLVEAIAAGKGPDVLLYSGDVINLAARNALVDLSKIYDIDKLAPRFSKDAYMPFTYENGVYALPLTQNFMMLFYRTDIFEELELKPPKTWDEFYTVTMALQKSKLTVGVPIGTATLADISMFSTLLYQMGGSFYNEDFSATAFETEKAIEAFTQWTEFYTKYRLPQSYTLLTRFRSGEMPMAIASYPNYNTFAVAAPEIKGLWEMAPIPGTIREDGTVNYTSISNSTPAMILSSCDRPEDAALFLDWFTSAQTQTTYALTVENVLGSGARYDPANLEALKNMYWTGSELKMLMQQMEQSTFTPVVPATYYVTRSLTNAYRAVTVKGLNPRESLYSYNLDINAEITRKRKELGFE